MRLIFAHSGEQISLLSHFLYFACLYSECDEFHKMVIDIVVSNLAYCLDLNQKTFS